MLQTIIFNMSSDWSECTAMRGAVLRNLKVNGDGKIFVVGDVEANSKSCVRLQIKGGGGRGE